MRHKRYHLCDILNASQFKSPFLKTKRTLAIKEIYYITQVNSATRKRGVVISAGNYPSSSETETKWLLNLLLNRDFGGLGGFNGSYAKMACSNQKIHEVINAFIRVTIIKLFDSRFYLPKGIV